MTGKEMQILRIRKNKKALEVSKIANISPSKLSLIENGHINLPEDLEKKLIQIINNI